MVPWTVRHYRRRIRPLLPSPSALLRPSRDQPLDAIQYEPVLVRPLQHWPDLA